MPALCALLAPSEQALVHALMIPAHRLLQGLIANATKGLGLSKAAAAAAATAVASGAQVRSVYRDLANLEQ